MKHNRLENLIDEMSRPLYLVARQQYCNDVALMAAEEVKAILSREHRRVVRMVKQSNPDRKAWPAFQRGYHLAKKDILAALKRDAKASK